MAGIDVEIIKILRIPVILVIVIQRIETHCIQNILGDLAGQFHDDIMMAAEDMLCFCPDLGFVFLHPAQLGRDILVGNKSPQIAFDLFNFFRSTGIHTVKDTGAQGFEVFIQRTRSLC